MSLTKVGLCVVALVATARGQGFDVLANEGLREGSGLNPETEERLALVILETGSRMLFSIDLHADDFQEAIACNKGH